MDMIFIKRLESHFVGIAFVFFGLALSLAGCNKAAKLDSKNITTNRQAFGWKAKDYFSDPQVIACCDAIVAKDIDKISQLLDAGVDVNTLGKDNMTLLLWSMPVPVSDDTQCFEALLKRGADPNIKLTGDLGTKQRIRPNDSVTTIAAKSQIGTFRLVLEHGADISQMDSWGHTLLHIAIARGSKKEKIQLLIDRGIDLDRYNVYGETPTQSAIGRGFNEIALILLKAGAKYDAYNENQIHRPIHSLLSRESRLGKAPGHDELLNYLVEQGENVAEAEEDNRRRASQVVPSSGFWEQEQRLMKKRDEQKALERAAKAKAAPDQE